MAAKWFILGYLSLFAPGCMGILIGDPHPYAYVTRMGSADAMGRWTVKQADGSKLHDGLRALTARMDQTGDLNEAERAAWWVLTIMKEVEGWPPARPLPAANGEQWTTYSVVQEAFLSIALDAYNHPRDEALLIRLRPDSKYPTWLTMWGWGMADLDRWRQEKLERD